MISISRCVNSNLILQFHSSSRIECFMRMYIPVSEPWMLTVGFKEYLAFLTKVSQRLYPAFVM